MVAAEEERGLHWTHPNFHGHIAQWWVLCHPPGLCASAAANSSRPVSATLSRRPPRHHKDCFFVRSQAEHWGVSSYKVLDGYHHLRPGTIAELAVLTGEPIPGAGASAGTGTPAHSHTCTCGQTRDVPP
jgi:hypothetical protein